ncbi:MAG: 5'-3' exonuclease H3TH domain-containing protein [Actinomycetota bacterium]
MYLDAPSLMYRAFFALPRSITDPSGRPVNAVRGFMDMVSRLVTDRGVRDVVAVFDAEWRPAWRVELYPGYKAGRPEDPCELPGQFDVVADVLDAAGIARAEAPGFEADDAIATAVATKEPDEIAGIVTGDRDLFALVHDPDVGLLYVAKGIRKLEQLDEAAVEERYGVGPALYADLAMLRGDASDGLPGVAGIGAVRAARLLNEFGSIDGIMDHLDELPAKQADALRAARDYLGAVAQIVPLVRDAGVESTAPHPPDVEGLRALADEHGLDGPTRRLLRVLGAQG